MPLSHTVVAFIQLAVADLIQCVSQRYELLKQIVHRLLLHDKRLENAEVLEVGEQ